MLKQVTFMQRHMPQDTPTGADTTHRISSLDNLATLDFRLNFATVVPVEPLCSERNDPASQFSPDFNHKKFSGVLLFYAGDTSHTLGSFQGRYIRLSDDPPLLKLGCNFETCDQNVSDCFGQVTACQTVTGQLQLQIRVASDVAYLSCRPEPAMKPAGSLTEVYHVFVGAIDSQKLETEKSSRKREICAIAKQEVDKNAKADDLLYCQYQALKEAAIACSRNPFQLTLDELGMVKLRQGFLTSQPLISSIVKQLMGHENWYGNKCDDACIRFFKSKDPPWDIFSVFNFLLRSKTPNKHDSKDIFGMTVLALCPPGSHDPHAVDKFRSTLMQVFLDIFCVRNWCAHLGASCFDCKKALEAVKSFVEIATSSSACRSGSACGLLPSTDALLKKLQSINISDTSTTNISIDDFAYVIFRRACHHLCKFCTEIAGTLRHLEFSEALRSQLKTKGERTSRRQSEYIEVFEVEAAVRNLKQSNFSKIFSQKHTFFDCDIIRGTRNCLSHASENGNQVILVLVALGAISRVSKFISEQCLASSLLPVGMSKTDVERAALLQQQGRLLSSEVSSNQAELLARANFCDIRELMCTLCDSQEVAIQNCSFYKLISGSGQTKTQFRAVQFLLDQKLCGFDRADQVLKCALFSKSALDSQNSQKALLRTLLYLIARIPPDYSQNLEDALNWLFEPQSAGLLKSCGLHLLTEDLENKGFFFNSAEKTGMGVYLEFVTKLKNMQDALSKATKLKREYQMRCFSTQKFSSAESIFRAQTQQSNLLLLESELQCWTARTEYLVSDGNKEALQPLHSIALKVSAALNEHASKKLAYDACSDLRTIEDLKSFLKRSGIHFCSLICSFNSSMQFHSISSSSFTNLRLLLNRSCGLGASQIHHSSHLQLK
jgi:hypothetical protein